MSRYEDKKEAEEFWKNYEEAHGEKVLAFNLGLYLRGCGSLQDSLWGLLIATDGGFRFHHFAQESWISALSRLTAGGGGKDPKEKTAFIPKENIIAAEYRVETNWFKKIFTASRPLFILQYYDDEGQKHCLVAETDKGSLKIIDALQNLTKNIDDNPSAKI
jgi:hypothetical protein